MQLGRQMIQMQAERFNKEILHILQTGSGEIVLFEMVPQVSFRGAVIRSSAAADQAELREAQRLMAESTRFGWIVDERAGFRMVAPSLPICDLLGVPFEHFNGSAV